MIYCSVCSSLWKRKKPSIFTLNFSKISMKKSRWSSLLKKTSPSYIPLTWILPLFSPGRYSAPISLATDKPLFAPPFTPDNWSTSLTTDFPAIFSDSDPSSLAPLSYLLVTSTLCHTRMCKVSFTFALYGCNHHYLPFEYMVTVTFTLCHLSIYGYSNLHSLPWENEHGSNLHSLPYEYVLVTFTLRLMRYTYRSNLLSLSSVLQL